MGDILVRLLLILGVIAAAGAVAYVSRRGATQHPPVLVAGLGLPPGIVVFTSTDCRRCKEALAIAKTFDVPLREITHELEPDLQKRAGVVGVPLTLVIDQHGELVIQIAGRPRSAVLRNALARAAI